MVNRLDSMLSNFRPTFVQRNAGDKPGEIKVVAGPDIRQLQNNIESSKEMSVKDVLQKYDLHSVTKLEMYSFVNILHEKKAVSEDTIDRLYDHTVTAFEDVPDDKKIDFVGFLEGLAGTSNAPGQIGENEKRILNTVIAEAKSIEFARSTGAEQITVDVTI